MIWRPPSWWGRSGSVLLAIEAESGNYRERPPLKQAGASLSVDNFVKELRTNPSIDALRKYDAVGRLHELDACSSRLDKVYPDQHLATRAHAGDDARLPRQVSGEMDLVAAHLVQPICLYGIPCIVVGTMNCDRNLLQIHWIQVRIDPLYGMSLHSANHRRIPRPHLKALLVALSDDSIDFVQGHRSAFPLLLASRCVIGEV